ncbi:hypothetical protein GA0070216_11010 [Micromonospora matsumotoense]|uniref:Uncharacterized protein n=1 Tax=Micromonospora matsumotoense TaxID=121616 RepID=A0A1C4ZJM3_9ACTN|nr:hypothetical protein [Micromonospora matsumotoense]SCF33158.1 hypothetical protein GA0070216_11010 [Micromonospora matsumotoense]
MIPEEGRPASWLGNYGGIEADIRQMREFADHLQAEVERNYTPHLRYIADDMTTAVPNPCDAFIELVHFLQAHWETQQATSDLVHGLAGATGRLATAANRIATDYQGADAFANARVTDVERALHGAQATAATLAGRSSWTAPEPNSPENPGPVVLP